MKHAFTLVEILIVVVILGILAAIVIPQFTASSKRFKAKLGASALPATQPAPSVAACGCEDCPIHGDRH